MANGENPEQTPPNEPAGTDGGEQKATPPAATQEPKGQGGATDGEETVTLKKEDYNNLISQRDRANNSNAENDAFIGQIAQERAIDSFLEENKKDYPDVKRDDLMHLEDPDMLESEAKRIQRRLQDHAQAKLLDVQQTTAPLLSPEERAQRLKKLKSSPGNDAFDQMIETKQAAA